MINREIIVLIGMIVILSLSLMIANMREKLLKKVLEENEKLAKYMNEKNEKIIELEIALKARKKMIESLTKKIVELEEIRNR